MSRFFTFLFFLILTFNLYTQEEGIRTKNNLGVEELVKNVFIKGNCRNVSNITAIGSETISIGQFENGGDIIDINDGIILSTGDIDLAEGPNHSSDASFAFNITSEDADLNVLATSTLFDATGIEFDFIPLDNRVTFRYVFASEEYCEFVGSTFNDVFGFFVSGPGINGTFDNNAINVAKLALTNEDVSINNVNHLSNENFYIDNVTNLDAENCMITSSPAAEDLIEYDGYTVALTASFQVIPCQTYHIRLIIGDVGDANLDSAVFLETNSFDLGEGVNVQAEVPGTDEPIAYESCVDGQFVFTRNDLTNLNEDYVISYSISPESEAINGIDFVEIPLSVTIPAGETSVVLPITILEDNILEGPEKLKLDIMYNCDCIDPSNSELIIDEATDFSVNLEPINVCPDQLFSITPEIIGGIAPYDFLWETGANTEVLETSITTPTQMTVEVIDFCGISSTGIIDLTIQEIPAGFLMGTYDLCEISESGIPVQLEGFPPWNISYSINDVEQLPIENIQTNPFYLSAPLEGTYELTAFEDAYCEGIVEGAAEVISSFVIDTNVIQPSCVNSSNGSVEIIQLDAVAPFSFGWDIETEDDYLLEDLIAGTYTLTLIDGDGCSYERAYELTPISEDLKSCIPIYVPNIFSPNKDGVNDTFSIFFEEGSGVASIISLQIFSRWGELVFEQSNFIPINGATEWKGEFKGKPLDMDIYVYQILIALEDGETLLVDGDVMLLR